MKILGKNEELCIECHACEETCAKAFFKEENVEKAALRIRRVDDTIKIDTCTQCGKCIDHCPVEAIYTDKNGIVKIKKDICVGCFICVGVCPEETMMQHDDHIEPFKCTSCGLCVKKCPTDAIFIEEK